MTVQVSEVQDLLKQANPSSPDAPAPGEAAEMQQNAPLSPQAQSGVGALSSRPAQSPTNAVPARSFAPDNLAPGSFSQKFFDAFKTLGSSGNSLSFPTMALAASAHAGSSEPAQDNGAAGSTTWESAQQNNDATKPTTGPAPPQNRAAGVINGYANAIGDSANAVGPGGAAGAVARTLQARGQRTAQEMKDREAMAVANAQMIHTQALVHKLGEEERQSNIQRGQQGLGLMMNAHVPGTKLFENKTSDQVHDMLKIDLATGKSHIDPSVDTVFPSGEVQVGTDANGLPLMRTTYSAVRPGGPVTFDGTNEEERNYINSQLGLKKGDPSYIQGPEDGKQGQTLPAVQINRLWEQAHGIETANAARDAAAAKQGLDTQKTKLDTADAEVKTNALRLLTGPDGHLVVQALAKAAGPNDSPTKRIVEAYNSLIGDQTKGPDGKTFIENHPNFPTEYGIWASGSPQKFQETLENYAKDKAKAKEAITGILGDDKFIVEHPDGAMAAAKAQIQTIANTIAEQQKIFNDPKSTDDQKALASFALSEAKQKDAVARRAQELAQDTIANNKQTAKEKTISEETAREQARLDVQEGGFGKVKDNALEGEEYLNALPPDQRRIVTAIGEGREQRSARQLQDKNGNPSSLAIAIHRAYPDFDISKAIAYPAVRLDFEKGKVSEELKHGSTALKHLNELQQLNTWESRNPLSADYAKYNNKLNTVIGELMQFYHMPGTDESVQSLRSGLGSLINRDSAIIEQAKSMGDRFGSIEQQWINVQPRPSFKPPMPNIDPAAKAAMARLNPEWSKEHTTFSATYPDQTNSPVVQTNPQTNSAQARPNTPSPTTHTFDSKAWATANPGKDVNAAIAQAKLQGYEVK